MTNKIKEEVRQQYFRDFTIGSKTDKGVITDLYFLKFNSFSGADKIYAPEPGKGICMAQVGPKAYSIGELKLERDDQ